MTGAVGEPGRGAAARFRVVADGPAPVEASYAYLSAPASRPAWQSSLRRVEDVHGDGSLGSSWTDVTTAGVRPRMEVVEAEPPRVWTEVGTWRRVRARLRMTFQPHGGGTRAHCEVEIVLPRWAAPAAWGLRLVAPPAVRADLRKALRQAGEAPARSDG